MAPAPHRLDKLLGWDYTLHASDFEIEVRPTRPVSRALGVMTFSPSVGPGEGLWDAAVVLRGPHGRGWLELEFYRARGVTRDEVQR